MIVQSNLRFPDEHIFRPGPIEDMMNLLLLPIRATIIVLEGVNRFISFDKDRDSKKRNRTDSYDDIL